jgi:hypothetical protein
MARMNKPQCPEHKQDLLIMYGCGWDYDRWLCPISGCQHEVELETITYPTEPMVQEETVISPDKRYTSFKLSVDAEPPYKHSITFSVAGKEMLRLEENGQIFVKGELTDTDQDVVNTFKEWLKTPKPDPTL